MSAVPAKTLSIGRAGLAPAIVALSEVSFDGDREVELGGWLRGAESLDELTATRDQLLGLVGNVDEPVVPVVCEADGSLSGWYRVRSVSVGSEPRMQLNTGSVLPWSAGLERVSSFASPVFDTRLLHAVRSGSAVTSASSDPLHGVPQTTTVYRRGASTAGAMSTRSIAGGGSVYVNVWAGSDSQANAEWQAPPAGFYDGAATITRLGGGVTGVPVVGKQAIVNPNTGWAVSNGLVSVVPSQAVGGTAGTLTIYGWTGTAFKSPVEIVFKAYSGNPVDTFSSVTVLRNSPEAVTIRLTVTAATWPFTTALRRHATVDLTVRRGDRNILGMFRTPDTTDLSMNPSGAPSGTGITGAVRRTSNDSDGNRYIIATALGTFVAISTQVTVASGSVLDVGVGHEIGGSGSSGIETAAALSQQYAAYVSERVLVANP